MLYTHFPEPPAILTMDNGCNLHDFLLNREPEHFRATTMYIDELHFAGHRSCCPAYNTGVVSAATGLCNAREAGHMHIIYSCNCNAGLCISRD